MNNKKKWSLTLLTVLFAALMFNSCKKQDFTTSTTTDVNILGYFEKNLDSFSLFKQILDRTETSAFLNAYGAYTCFAPTNSGVTSYLASLGAANVEAADINVLKEMVKFHLLTDTINTSSFKDGKLPVPTMQGQFLITGVATDANGASYTVNRQAAVTRSNIKTGNGIIHVITRVLVPANRTIAQQLEANPNYSIFVQALKETGYYTLLNTVNPDTTKRWKTVLAESNKALGDSGFTSYAALKARYSKTGNPANVADSLNIYVAYHILDGLKFLGDIITAPTHLTLQPQEVISTQLINEDVIVNEDVFNGILERGILLTRNISDNSATNGVWHDANAHFVAKFRKPTALYWDVCTFPEIMKLAAFYKKATFVFPRQSEADRPIKDINWEYTQFAATATYFYGGSGSTLTQNAVNFDVLTLPLGPPSRAKWFELTTPVIVKGRYKVWVCYSAQFAVLANVRVNGELMQRPVNFGEFKPAGTDAELESIGWKQYTVTVGGGRSASRLVGIVDIKTTQRQIIRFEPYQGTNAEGCRLDMIHFIPVDENQVSPKFRTDGTPVY
ncbi:MAG: hypothetical protein JWQ96_3017 [Segetibacter sp.]|nr:hypothetical protein [Segetibacter sp.]